MKRWPLVALVLLLTLFIAPVPSTKAQKKEADQSARKIKELQKERIATLKAVAEVASKLFQAGRAKYVELIEARRQLLKAELDAAEKESERITILKKTVDTWKESEKKVKELQKEQKERIATLEAVAEVASKLFQAGRAEYVGLIEARRQLLKVELDAAEKRKQVARVTEAAVLTFKAMRLEAEIDLERAKGKEAKERKIKDLQKERIATLVQVVNAASKQFQLARVRYSEVIEAVRMLLKAELEAAEKESDRITIWKNAVDTWKQYEERAEMLFQFARVTVVPVLTFRAMRREAEIELERAKPKEAKEGKIKELQKERIATLKKLSECVSDLYTFARATGAEVIDARRMLLKAKLDAAEKESERVTILKNFVDKWKESEKLAEELTKSARVSGAAVLQFKAMRLEAEIELERAKARAAKERK